MTFKTPGPSCCAVTLEQQRVEAISKTQTGKKRCISRHHQDKFSRLEPLALPGHRNGRFALIKPANFEQLSILGADKKGQYLPTALVHCRIKGPESNRISKFYRFFRSSSDFQGQYRPPKMPLTARNNYRIPFPNPSVPSFFTGSDGVSETLWGPADAPPT